MEFNSRIMIMPTPKRRPRFSNRGKFVAVYTDRDTRDAEAFIGLAVKTQMEKEHLEQFKGALMVHLWFNFLRPKTNKSIYCMNRKDIDNCAKLVLDALNGILYKDDSQIVSLFLYKQYANEDSIVLKLQTLD